MFEHKSKPLAHKNIFYKRLLIYWILGTSLIIFSLMLGSFGYKYFGNLNFIDAFYNASMILSGMGPALDNANDPVKIFSSFYALYCGIIFLSSVTIAFAPIVHRFFHVIHLESQNQSD